MSQQSKPKNGVVNIKQKRIQIDDDDGWTHITTTPGGRSKTSKRKPKSKSPVFHDQLLPAETPGNLTFRGLEEQFQLHRSRWEDSQCHDTVKRGLESALLKSSSGSGEERERITRCVCIGLGSPSGFLRGGWVDRRAISLYQLAGLVSMLDWISSSNLKSTWDIKQIYAQDPVFNKMDKKLLSSLNIQVVNDPVAFDLVHRDTFLYCPGAERSHLVDLLGKEPSLFFGGPLEDGYQSLLTEDEENVLSRFTQTRESIQLPPFQPDEHAFWNMRLYWKREED